MFKKLTKAERAKIIYVLRTPGEQELDMLMRIWGHTPSQVVHIMAKEFADAEPYGGKHCVTVSFSGREKPYYAYGRAYMRVADADRQLSAKELENIILAKNHNSLRWDDKFSEAALDDLYRVDVPEISTAALREAIINAFCHRDYRDNEEVRVAIFKERVEIRNPGSLYGTRLQKMLPE